MPKKRVVHRKPASQRRVVYLRARMTLEQRADFEAAARRMGVTLSAWAISTLWDAARRSAAMVA